MSIGSLNPLNNSYVQSLLTSAIQGAGLTTNTANNSLSSLDALTSSSQPDKSQLSPFAQMMSELQQLQQSDPAKYQQVTGQIATNLQSASQTAQANGNTTAATELSKLSSDFTNASQNGQLPSVQDLASAVGGGHHHHHHHAAASSGDSSTTSTAGTASTSTSQTLSQMLSAYESNGAQSNSLDPASIIFNTLSSAGITGA